MQVTSFRKHQIALELLDRAIELYLRGDSYFSALHLGAASEELFMVYAREIQLPSGATMRPAFDEQKEAIVALQLPKSLDEKKGTEKRVHDLLNHAKNSVKHMRGSKDEKVSFDPCDEAFDVIDRAISTYLQLQSAFKLPPLQSISEFVTQGQPKACG